MKRRRRLFTRFLPLAIAAISGLLWQFCPVQSIQAVASLSDPAKLRTLGERGANSRLNKIVFWLDDARGRGWSPEFVVRLAQMWNGTREPRGALVEVSLLRNLKIADELGLLTSGNRRHLRQGHAAVVTIGPYAGESVEIDHIAPHSLAPEAGNELANLEMLPRTLNRQKSNNVGKRQLVHAQRLHEGGLLTRESLERVRSSVLKPPPPSASIQRR